MGQVSEVQLVTTNGLPVAVVLLPVVILIIWFVVATAASVKGDQMEAPNRMAQMYGYTACLICFITALFSFGGIVSAAFDRAHPLQGEYPYSMALSSFEAYKATRAREPQYYTSPEQQAKPDTSSDATLRERYKGLVE